MKESTLFEINSILTANFIGCGKLGKTIAYLLVKNNLIKLQNIFNRSLASSQNSIKFIGKGEACVSLNVLKPADIYFICTPDDEIKKICEDLIQIHKPPQNSIFIHFSGALTSDVLESAEKNGHSIGSLHPNMSFSRPEESVKRFQGTFCAFEGSIRTFEIVANMMRAIGGNIFSIQKEKKGSYHAAAVFACNYLITLAHCAQQCYMEAGLSEDVAKNIVISFMQGTLNNLSIAENPSEALTGPLQRGDVNTIKKHIEALDKMSQLNEAYKLLGKLTIGLTKHSDRDKLFFSNIFENDLIKGK